MLLKPRKSRKARRVPPYTCLGCPLTHSRTQWCYALCTPKAGLGLCGRTAPHAIKGRTQRAIAEYKRKKLSVL